MILTQKERLEKVERSLKEKKRTEYTIPQKVCLEKLKIIRQHPEYNDKLDHFEAREVYATSNKDIIIFAEVGRIKQR